MAKALTKTLVLLSLFIAALSFPGKAQADILFDFESLPVDGIEDGSLGSLILSDSGLVVSILRTSGATFDVLNDDAVGFPDAYPPTWGDQALSPFVDSSRDDFFLVNFSRPIQSFTIEMGDFGGGDDLLTVEAWSGTNATGNLLDVANDIFSGSFNANGAGDPPSVLTVTGVGIRAVLFRGGENSDFPNSVYYDNMRIVIPEPGSLGIVALSGLLILGRRRRKIAR